MAKSISARLGLTRWGAGPDTWSRAELDANFGQLEALVGVVRADLAANRGVPARSLEFFVATDTGMVSFGRVAGGSWVDFGRLGSANTWTALGSFTAGLAVTGGLTVDSITASKSIYGAHGTLAFTNEAARDAFYSGIGGIVGTQFCFLTAPTTLRPGWCFYDGSRWRPLDGHHVEAAATQAQNLATGASAVILFTAPALAVDTTGGMWSPSTGLFTAAYACTVEACGSLAATLTTAGDRVVAYWSKNGASTMTFRTTPTTAANQIAQAILPPLTIPLAAGDTLSMRGQTVVSSAQPVLTTSNETSIKLRIA